MIKYAHCYHAGQYHYCPDHHGVHEKKSHSKQKTKIISTYTGSTTVQQNRALIQSIIPYVSYEYTERGYQMTRTIVFTSGKGGVGKTTSTANVGMSLALLGYKVCLIDLDIGLRNLDIPLGLSNRIIFDILDIIHGNCKNIDHALIKDKHTQLLSFLPGSKNGELSELSPMLIKDVIRDIQTSGSFDFILIDSPAGIETGFKQAVSLADEAIIVTTSEKTALQDADRVIGILEDVYQLPAQLLINFFPVHQKQKHAAGKLDMVTNRLNIPLIGVISEDEEVITSVHQGKPIALDSKSSNGLRFRHIAKNIINHQQHKSFQFHSHTIELNSKQSFRQKLFHRAATN